MALPSLSRIESHGLTVFADGRLLAERGLIVAFTTRRAGVSVAPWAGLDLAGHTGDDPAAVMANRTELLSALGLDPGRLVTADQVHGTTVAIVGEGDAGRGAGLGAGPEPIAGTDALVTTARGVPLLMMFADCVPVVIAAPDGPRPGVAVAHAGWKGAIGSIPGLAVAALADASGASPGSMSAYIGPHIGPCHYEVSEELASSFRERFPGSSHSDGLRSASPRVDLGAAVRSSLGEAGVTPEHIVGLDLCTAENLDLFFSYRAEGVTGRHGALAAVL